MKIKMTPAELRIRVRELAGLTLQLSVAIVIGAERMEIAPEATIKLAERILRNSGMRKDPKGWQATMDAINREAQAAENGKEAKEG